MPANLRKTHYSPLCTFLISVWESGADGVASCQLLTQSAPVPPATGVLFVFNIKHVAPAEYYVRCTWSAGIRFIPVSPVIHTSRLGKTSPAFFCPAALVHVSLTSILLVLPVIILLPGRPRFDLGNPMPISIDLGKEGISSLGSFPTLWHLT